ncbi:MAG: amidohydrolase family protein [Janthinobacterium lividum]
MTQHAPIAADTLITGATIVTMDAGRRVIVDGALAIGGDRIVAVGARETVEAAVVAREHVDGRRFVMTPGFINGHIHVTETLLKNLLPENLDFDEAIWRWIVPMYRSHSAGEQRIAAQLAALGMLRSGTTCFLEAGTILDLDEVVDALAATGIRGRVGRWTQDRAFDSVQDQTRLTDEAIAGLEAELDRHPGTDGRLISAWPVLVGHNTCTDALWQAAKSLADAHAAGVSAHMSPVEGDTDWFMAATGRRPIEHLHTLGVLGSNVSLTHAVHVGGNEIELLAQTGTNVIHCPLAALKGGYGATTIGQFPEMAAAGVNLLLGTDGADQADLMRAIHLVAGLFKDARRDRGIFPAADALVMATNNGARALGLDNQIGSLDVGRKADLVLHDTDRPEWRPLHDPVRQLVWSADGRGVHSVWIDGRRVIENYRCTTIDEERLYAEAQQAADAIAGRFDIGAA